MRSAQNWFMGEQPGASRRVPALSEFGGLPDVQQSLAPSSPSRPSFLLSILVSRGDDLRVNRSFRSDEGTGLQATAAYVAEHVERFAEVSWLSLSTDQVLPVRSVVVILI